MARILLALLAESDQTLHVGQEAATRPATRTSADVDTQTGAGQARGGGPAPWGESAALEAYLTERRHEMAEQTLREKRRLLLDLAEFAGTPDPLTVAREHIVGFLDHVATHGRPHRLPDGTTTKRRTKAGAKSRKTYISHIRAFFDWAVQTERLRRSPAEAIRTPRVLRKQMRAFTTDEVVRILAASSGQLAVYFRTLYVSGIRATALATAPTFAFVLTADSPRVELPPKRGKQGNGYVAALDDHTAHELRELLESRGPDHRPSEPLFALPRVSKLGEQLVRICKRAGVAVVDDRGRRAGLHCFRRANITHTLDLGFDAKIAQLQAGHADVSTTLRNYTDRGIDDQAQAARALAAGLGVKRVSIPPDTGQPTTDKLRKNREKGLANGPGKPKIGPATFPMNPRHSTSVGTTEPLRRGASLHNRREGSVPTDVSFEPARHGEQASMSKWAILDSNQYPAQADMPPRIAGVIHHALRVAERWFESRTAGLVEPSHDDVPVARPAAS